MRFNHKNSPEEDYVALIAEDVPELVAMSDREAFSAMDIVGVLTKVVQEQPRFDIQDGTIRRLQEQLAVVVATAESAGPDAGDVATGG